MGENKKHTWKRMKHTVSFMFRLKNNIHRIIVWCFLKKPPETATETLEIKRQ